MDESHRAPSAAQGVGGETPLPNTVGIADDEVAFRLGVRRELESGGFTVVAEASSAHDAVAAAVRCCPSVCLVDIALPGSGIIAAEQIRNALPDTKIVMLASSDRDDDVFASLRAGADGYLLKSTPAKRLSHVVRGVLHGEAALSRSLTARLIGEYRNRDRHHRLPVLDVVGEPVELTSREFEVLTRLQRGGGTAAIARELRISEVTVRRHISAVLHKIGVPDRRTALALLDRAARASAPPDVPPRAGPARP